MGEELLKPAEVCRRLGMPPSTLRIYSTKFSEVLSEGAARPTVTGDGKVGYRVYNGRDLMVLKKSKELLGQGLTYDQVLAELRLVVPGRGRSRGVSGAPGVEPGGGEGAVVAGPDLDKVLGVLARAVSSAEKSAETCQSVVRDLAGEVGDVRKRVDRLETLLRRSDRGFWRRLFGG